MKRNRRSEEKGWHPNNEHKHGYDFEALVGSHLPLSDFIRTNQHGGESVDFADPRAVKELNRALLRQHYGVDYWDIPEGFLCPPIPGRVDYIHHVADLLKEEGKGAGESVRMLDVGTGANGVYAILASRVYAWQCTASDIDPVSIENLEHIIGRNPSLQGEIDPRLQADRGCIFKGIIREGEFYDVSVCNPPFHASLEEALKGSQKKCDNLAASRNEKTSKKAPLVLNFGGQKAELWCAGGESRFLKRMIKESKAFASQCGWFTSLVSKSDNVQPALKLLRKQEVTEHRLIEMQQGNKVTRVLAWTYLH